MPPPPPSPPPSRLQLDGRGAPPVRGGRRHHRLPLSGGGGARGAGGGGGAVGEHGFQASDCAGCQQWGTGDTPHFPARQRCWAPCPGGHGAALCRRSDRLGLGHSLLAHIFPQPCTCTCAGSCSHLLQSVSHALQGLPPGSVPPLWLAKGSYYSAAATAGWPPARPSAGAGTAGTAGFRHLVYPLPEPGTAGLGTHLTLDLAGGIRFGPDVEW